jgi:signal transduction histidine kinase
LTPARALLNLSPVDSGVLPADAARDAAADAERARTLRTLLVAGMGVLALGAMSSLFREGPWSEAGFPYVAMLIGHAIVLAVLRAGRLRLAVAIHVALYLAVVGTVMVLYGGIRSPAGFVLPPIVLLAGLTWSGRAALATAVAAALLTVGLVVLEQQGRLPPATSPPPALLAVVIVATLLITGAILAVALRTIGEARGQAAEHERVRRLLESRLSEARRLETVARVAAGAAHDFNNVLTVIVGMTSTLHASSDPDAASAATAIEGAATSAAKLTRMLLTFGRKQALDVRRVDVGDVVREAEPLLRQFARGCRLVLDLKDRVVARADPTQLQQALFNLVSNSADATPSGGTICVRLAVPGPDELAQVPEWEPGASGAIVLEVRDTGAGMLPEAKAHLFEPFFTTKPPGKGTGLGLASVHGIVAQLGGVIAVETAPGKGTAVQIFLPRSTPEPPEDQGGAAVFLPRGSA